MQEIGILKRHYPLFIFILLFSGVYRAVVYYQVFGIRILQYLKISESLIIFSDDLFILLLSTLNMYLQNRIGSDIYGLFPKINYQTRFNIGLGLLIFLTLGSLLYGLFFDLKSLHVYALTAIFICLLGFINVFRSSLLTYLSGFEHLDSVLSQAHKNIINVILNYFLILTFFTILMGIGIRTNGKKSYWHITLKDGSVIQTTQHFYVVGKTEDFIYFFDNDEKVSTVLSNSEIQKIEHFLNRDNLINFD